MIWQCMLCGNYTDGDFEYYKDLGVVCHTCIEYRESKVNALCEGLYSIMNDMVKPADKQAWINKVYSNVRLYPIDEFERFCNDTQAIIDFKDE